MTTQQSESLDFQAVPLLNRYKHGLTKKRLFQTLTGGLKPLHLRAWCFHLGQLALYTVPILLCLPFVTVDSLRLWNSYYLAAVYGCLAGIVSLTLSITGVHMKRVSATEVVPVGPQLADEEEDSMDFSSCIQQETFRFIFAPKKPHSVLLHPLISGVLSFAGCFILFPRVAGEVMPVGAVVVVIVFGWATLCNALHSMNVSPPPETATYRPTDPHELRFLTRAVYVLALAVVFFIVRAVVSDPSLYLRLVYASLCLLPVGWLLGVLPPLDALFPWVMEQALTKLMGGSAMATDLRLLIAFSLSLTATTIVAVITNRSIAVLLATAFGFLLSQDFFSHLKFLVYLLSLRCSRTWGRGVFSKTYTSYFFLGDFRPVSNLGKYSRSLTVDVARGIAFLLASLVFINLTFDPDRDAKGLPRIIFAAVLIVGYLFMVVSDNLQGVYILGVFRNPLYPYDCENVKKFCRKRTLLSYASIPKRVLIAYVYPLLLVACIGLSLETKHTDISHIWFGITASRILRKVWQDTAAAHLELLIVNIIHLSLPSDGSWAALGLGTQALIIGLSLDIASDFLWKLQFAATLIITFIGNKKQRSYRPLNVAIIVGCFLLFPILLVVILISSIFSTPLLPLFTLPIFLLSFPRTRRFWPSLVSYGTSHSKCRDTIYYRQAEAAFAKAITSGISTGAIRCVYPGSHLLLRFQDRLAVATILETGCGYAAMIFRGLELQETSCHAVEATRVDDIFESVYNRDTKSCMEFWLNIHILNTLQPVESAVVHAYSDARNVLSGIINQPSALEHFSTNLLKCLVWVLFHHICPRQQEGNDQNGPSNRFLDSVSPSTDLEARDNAVLRTLNTEEVISANPRQHVPTTFPDTSWSGSVSSLDMIDRSRPNPNPASPIRISPLLHDSMVEPPLFLPGLIPEERPVESENEGAVFSQTTIDTDISEVRLSGIAVNGVFPGNAPQKNHARASRQVHPKVDGGFKWRDLPLPYGQTSKLLRSFPQEWLDFIKDSAGVNYIPEENERDFMKLVMVCLSLVDVPCSSQLLGGRSREAKTTPYDVYQGFCGNFPYSSHLDWLLSDQALNSAVLKAYRYAVRLLYDEASLGEIENMSELMEYLEDYDGNYFIGTESEVGWEEAILAEKPCLFSLGRDPEKDVYTTHVLTLQDEIVHLGRLNPEAVRAVWADLSLELLYLTNDDEERYSIQAHPTLLRNLTIQMADPPLGYSVYSSGIIRIPRI